MNKGLTILAVAGGGFLLYLANKGRAAAKLEFYFNDVDLSSLKLTEYKIGTSMTVVNPSNTEQKVDAVFANVFMADGYQIGRIEQTTVQTIPARQSSTLSVPVSIFPAGLGKLAAYVIKNKSVPTLKISGTVISLGISIPFEQTI